MTHRLVRETRGEEYIVAKEKGRVYGSSKSNTIQGNRIGRPIGAVVASMCELRENTCMTYLLDGTKSLEEMMMTMMMSNTHR